MGETLPFFIVLAASVLVSLLMRRLHVPWVIALILGGVAIGPFGLNLVEPDPTLNFLGDIGLVFLLFMAGLESSLATMRQQKTKIFGLSLINGLVPALIGFGLAAALGIEIQAAAVIGIIFMSSSVAVVLPILESTGMLHSRIGNTIIGITVLEDLASLLLLSLLLQSFQTVATVPLWILYPLLGVLLLVFRWLVPRIRLIVGRHTPVESQLFQQDLRVILSILIGTVLVFELLGLHAIIGAFFAGLVLSDSIRSETLRHKLQSISYGLFVPVFFILLGTQADLSVFTATHVLWITLAITAASITSKFLTGYIGGRLTGLSSQQAGILGIATTPQLSTSLAAAITSVEVGLLSIQYLPVIVGLTLITTLIGPIITRLLISRYQAQPVT